MQYLRRVLVLFHMKLGESHFPLTKAFCEPSNDRDFTFYPPLNTRCSLIIMTMEKKKKFDDENRGFSPGPHAYPPKGNVP